MPTILTPEQVREKYGPMFCKSLITMVDEKNGCAQVVEKCSSTGPKEWDIVNRKRTKGIITDIRDEGAIVMDLAARHRARILPVDSEHSAIFQCLAGEQSPIRRLIVTCSGGALRDVPASELASVTPERALKHPQWSMGAKITIDSATLVNKGFEVIEAHWLFGVEAEKISVLIHPQSIVHSMVEFEDGAIKAQLGTPDMHMPISYALMFPRRASRPEERFDFLANPTLTFAEPDRVKYPALDIASQIRSIACSSLSRLGAKPPSSPTAVEYPLDARILLRR